MKIQFAYLIITLASLALVNTFTATGWGPIFSKATNLSLYSARNKAVKLIKVLIGFVNNAKGMYSEKDDFALHSDQFIHNKLAASKKNVV